jgi:two-component system, NtrC family, nitrogen regulation sensor histidine kinase NtrY
MESEAANHARGSTEAANTPRTEPRAHPSRKPKRRLSHENRILLLTLASGAAGVALALILLWTGDHDSGTKWSLTFLVVMIWLGFAFALRSAVIRPLQTLSNMQSALREGDFSFRVRGAKMGDALGELMIEVNTLSEMLREQRLGAMEASALLTTVMTEIDVAVFAFDGDRRLRLVNRAGERVMAQNAERLLGKSAEELGLLECLEGESARTLEKSFPGHTGRWGVRRSVFRQGGKPHYLVVIADLSRALREEERQAWQRLVRVLGHELNNSLAPICSIAGSLEDIMKREVRAADWEDDLRRGLRVIVDRSDALSRFMRDYSRLTRLPKPQLRSANVDTLVRVAAGLERRTAVDIEPGPEVMLNADPDQLQQLLINLIRNAVDASLENGGKVRVGWSRNGSWLHLFVQDEGSGIANPSNLFVPFFTTKPGGSGIGLALCRQIAEAHGGSISLHNRTEGKGCEAVVQLPLEVSGE